jgi:methionine-rich copper-binding protein CopC
LRRKLQGPAFLIPVILILLTAVVQPLWAHAVLMQSKPTTNSTVKGPNVPIWLRFNVRVDGKRSRLQVIAADGSTIPVESPKQSAPDVLESNVSGLKPGAYKLQWRVLASDGHMSSGIVDFTVN